jgi:hypothetical protein
MPSLAGGFTVNNGDLATASYLNTWFSTGTLSFAAGKTLLGNSTLGGATFQEIPLGSNLAFSSNSASAALNLVSSPQITGTLGIGVAPVSSIGLYISPNITGGNISGINTYPALSTNGNGSVIYSCYWGSQWITGSNTGCTLYNQIIATPTHTGVSTGNTGYQLIIQPGASSLATSFGLVQQGSTDTNTFAGPTTFSNTLTVTGTSTFTGAVLVGTTSYTTTLSVGNNTSSTGTTTPANINLGFSYGTNAAGNAGNLKVILYPGGNGIGIDSLSQIEYQSGAGISQAFYTNGGTLALTLDASQNATFAGKVIHAASTTGKASANIPSGTGPTSPVDGDMWYDGTNVKFRVGGTTKTFTLT